MFSYFGGKVGSIQDSFYDSGYKGGTVEAPLVLRDGDKCVDQGLLLDDVVGPLVVIGVLQLVSLLPEQSLPQRGLHHQQRVQELQLPLGSPVPDKH